MDFSSKLLENLVYNISQLIGIGKRSALRIALEILKKPTEYSKDLSDSIREFRDKILEIEERKKNMTFRDWVEMYTSPGRERGGTCQRPDIFLHNDKACDGCPYYEYCMCYGKRLSHEKRKPKRR